MNCNTIAALRNLSLGNATTASAFPTVAGGTVRASVGLNADLAGGIFDGNPFQVRAVFKAAPGASGNFTASVYWYGDQTVTDLTTFTSDKIFLTSGAVALGTQAASTFVLSATLVWDSSAQRITGVNDANSFHTIATPAVLFSGASAVTATNNPVATSVASVDKCRFFATGLFGTSNAGNSVKLVELAINQL
jgi:hypothetical protein